MKDVHEIQDKIKLERVWLGREMSEDPDWHSMHSTHRDYVHVGKVYCIWSPSNGVPVKFAEYRVASLGLSLTKGLQVEFEATVGTMLECEPGAGFTLTAKPLAITSHDFPEGKFYLWTPGFADMRFVPLDFNEPASSRSLSIPICAKQRNNPKVKLLPGEIYFSSRIDFLKIQKHYA